MWQSKSCQLLHNGVGTSYTTNPEQIEILELEGYSRPTWHKLRASSHGALGRLNYIHWLDRRRVLLTTPATFWSEIF